MYLPGFEPRRLDSPARIVVAIPTEIFQPVLSRRKYRYGKVNFQRQDGGLQEDDVMWYTGKLRPFAGARVGVCSSSRNGGVVMSTRIHGVTYSRIINFKLLIIGYLMDVTWKLNGGRKQY